MLTDHAGLSRFERLLTLFTRVRPGEGRSAFLFFLHGFLLLFSYQVVKALREAFMLTKFPAEVRAYAVALIAIIWGATFVVIKNALADISPIYFNTVRMVLAALCMVAAAWFMFRGASSS